MLRSAASKVAWAGRTASMVFGLALILALLFGVASMAFGANGGIFVLGKLNNAATAVTGLVGNVDGGGGPAGDQPQRWHQRHGAGPQGAGRGGPMRVNATAGKATNLNADQIDGLDSTELRQRTGVYTVSEVHEGMANTTTFDALPCDEGDEVLAGGYVGLSPGARVVASHSQSRGTEWVTGLESGSTAGSLNMVAECYDYPPGHVESPSPLPELR